MGIFKSINNRIQGWLFKEEIAEMEQRREQGLPVTKEEFEEVRQAEIEKMERLTKIAMEKINSEDHSKKPSHADINRYFEYHENYVHNMQGLEKHVEKLWTKAPESTIPFERYVDEAQEKGWAYLRSTCGLPTGDLSKPSTPWVAGQKGTNWNTSQQTEAETEEVAKPKHKKRGM